MGDLFFVLRMLCYTLVVSFAMQVKIGPETVEEKVINWSHKTKAANFFTDVADGAILFVNRTWKDLAGEREIMREKITRNTQRVKKEVQEKKKTWEDSWYDEGESEFPDDAPE